MKTSLILLVLFMFCGAVFQLSSQTHYYIIPYQRFELKDSPQFDWFYNTYAQKRTEIIETPTFQISHQITVKEYRQFLQDMKNQVCDSMYQKLLPDSAFFKKGTYQKYIYSDEYDKYPIVAVTWESAIRFCKWKTVTENQGDSIRFIFRLPTRHEWLAAKRFYNTVKNGHDFGTCFSDWLYNEYIEIEKKNYSRNHNKPREDTTNRIKQRLIFGKSFLMYTDNMDVAGYKQFANQSYPDVAFRCVKVQVSRPNVFPTDSVYRKLFFNYSIEYKLLSKWNLLQKIVLEKPDTQKKELLVVDQTFADKNDENFLGYTYYRRPKNDKPPLRVTGEVRNRKQYGDWYFFRKNGELKKHIYYTLDGKRQKIPINVWSKIDEKIKSKAIHQRLFDFGDSLISINPDNSNNAVETSMKYFYQTKNGLRDGCFLYSDYEITVAGKYTGNSKTGLWCMWNCDGKLMLQRRYTKNFEFETIYTVAPQNKLTRILYNGGYCLERNTDGYYDYFQINENDILFEKVIWRTLQPKNNQLLYNNAYFFKTIQPHITSGEVAVYTKKRHGYYNENVKVNDLNQIYNPDIHELSVFRIKETNIFDRKRCMMECRALNVYIVLKNKKTGNEKAPIWFYIPDTRKILAKKQLPENNLPEFIQNLDDFFFFRCYSGEIYAESNVYSNRKLSDYLHGQIAIKREQQRIEEKIIDMTYSFWKYCTNGKINQ